MDEGQYPLSQEYIQHRESVSYVLHLDEVTDDERTFFRITIPCHEAAGNIIADIAHKDGSLKAS